MNPDFGPVAPLVLVMAALGYAALRSDSASNAFIAIGCGLVVIALPFALEVAHVGTVQIVPALVLLVVDAIFVQLIALKHKFALNRFIDAATGLPNIRALRRQGRRHDIITIVTVSILQFEEMETVLTADDHKLLLTGIIARLSVAFPGAIVHSADIGTIALLMPANPSQALDDEIDAASALFRAPVALAHRAILVTPTFGASTGKGSEARQVLAEARYAAREAQRIGRRVGLHTGTSISRADRSLTLLADAERALASGEIHVVYQPKWNVAQARIAGAEALIRWTHPVFGRVSPDEFIPLFEANGQMRALTLRVIELGTGQLRCWHAEGHDISIAINVSAGLFDDTDFVSELTARLQSLGALAAWMTIELTESATVSNAERAISALTTFRKLGARVSIDDYGTGHATLAYLKSFPADEIKIDKSFVTNLLTNRGDQIVVRSTIELAHELGFKVVAEGVEDQQCFAQLVLYGCDMLQGWHIGKPMDAAGFEAHFNAPLRLSA